MCSDGGVNAASSAERARCSDGGVNAASGAERASDGATMASTQRAARSAPDGATMAPTAPSGGGIGTVTAQRLRALPRSIRDPVARGARLRDDAFSVPWNAQRKPPF